MVQQAMATLEAAQKGGAASPETLRCLQADVEQAKAKREAAKKPEWRMQAAAEKVEKRQWAAQAAESECSAAEQALEALRAKVRDTKAGLEEALAEQSKLTAELVSARAAPEPAVGEAALPPGFLASLPADLSADLQARLVKWGQDRAEEEKEQREQKEQEQKEQEQKEQGPAVGVKGAKRRLLQNGAGASGGDDFGNDMLQQLLRMPPEEGEAKLREMRQGMQQQPGQQAQEAQGRAAEEQPQATGGASAASAPMAVDKSGG